MSMLANQKREQEVSLSKAGTQKGSSSVNYGKLRVVTVAAQAVLKLVRTLEKVRTRSNTFHNRAWKVLLEHCYQFAVLFRAMISYEAAQLCWWCPSTDLIRLDGADWKYSVQNKTQT
jgi:hypothetical protein